MTSGRPSPPHSFPNKNSYFFNITSKQRSCIFTYTNKFHSFSIQQQLFVHLQVFLFSFQAKNNSKKWTIQRTLKSEAQRVWLPIRQTDWVSFKVLATFFLNHFIFFHKGLWWSSILIAIFIVESIIILAGLCFVLFVPLSLFDLKLFNNSAKYCRKWNTKVNRRKVCKLIRTSGFIRCMCAKILPKEWTTASNPSQFVLISLGKRTDFSWSSYKR